MKNLLLLSLFFVGRLFGSEQSINSLFQAELNNKLFNLLANGRGTLKSTKDLITQGAQINARNETGITLLMQASENGYEDIAEYFIQNGADINATDNQEEAWTALSFATYNNRVAIVKLFIEKYNANINTLTKSGFSLLIIAAMSNSFDVVQYLIAQGADKNIKDCNGKTAEENARELYNHTIANYLAAPIHVAQIAPETHKR